MITFNKIALSGAPNARDLGGYETTDGRRIKPKRLLRSGELSRTTEEDRRILTEEYNLKTVIDFRTDTERLDKPEIGIPGVEFIHLPIIDESTLGITREKPAEREMFGDLFGELAKKNQSPEEYMASVYQSICTTDFSLKQYGRFFEILLNQTDGAVLWHCSAGKDRVGLGTALLFLALDVPQEIIIEDYLFTGTCLQAEIDAAASLLAPRMPDVDTASLVQCLLGVRRSYIDTLFDTISHTEKPVSEFLRDTVNLDKQKILDLKKLYLENK